MFESCRAHHFIRDPLSRSMRNAPMACTECDRLLDEWSVVIRNAARWAEQNQGERSAEQHKEFREFVVLPEQASRTQRPRVQESVPKA
jgi:hypothetical protein